MATPSPPTSSLGADYEQTDLRREGRIWHQLRHTYASTLAAGGVKRHEVEQLMGHRAVGTTSIYTHLFRQAYHDVERVLNDVYDAWLSERERPIGPRLRKVRRRILVSNETQLRRF